MANGGYWASKDEWQRVEAPLLEVDSILNEFASEFGHRVTKNHKDWPERSIEWGVNIRRLVQLYLADEKDLTFNLWLCASQDRDGKRYWKQENLVKGCPIAEFQHHLPSLLREGRAKLEGWNESDLEFATNLGRI